MTRAVLAGCLFLTSVPAEGAPAHKGDKPPACDEAAEMKGDRPVLPPGASDVGGPEDVDEDRGLVSDLYPGASGGTDSFYPLPCEPSIGGTLPPDEPPTQQELDAEKELEEFEHNTVPDIVGNQKLGIDIPSPLPDMTSGKCYILDKADKPGKPGPRKEYPCDSGRFLRSGQPFEGRDIIYVHGLATDHLKKWLVNYAPARKLWPQDASEFLNPGGYFRQYADNYWRDHIHENLFDPQNPSNPNAGWQWTASDSLPRYNPKSNRYLTVAWSSNQQLPFGQHAFLTQVAEAMSSNTNVVTPPTYPTNQIRPFCSNGCIVISHSTGDLLTATALSLGKSGAFGPAGVVIANHIRAHVAFEGAVSGSRLGTLGVAVAMAPNPGGMVICPVLDSLLGLPNACLGDTSFIGHSILVDLIPAVAQGVWGPIVNLSPVPTLTVAGGHPTGDYFPLTKFILPGLDDGVATMNSACGNPNPVSPGALAPSGSSVTSLVKAFEMSKSQGMLLRAAKNFLSHKNLMGGATPGAKYLAAACTPYLSPTGMVMPVENPYPASPWDARARYHNFYSFLQGSIDHSYDGGSNAANPWPSSVGAPASTLREYFQNLGPNREEVNAVTNSAVYVKAADGTYLVHPSFNKSHEIVRGKVIKFKLFKKTKRIWIWKRTFHLLDKWEVKQSSHYVYEFVGRR
jgi:hypothetical protein